MNNLKCNRIVFLFTNIIILVNSESLMGGHLDNQQQSSTTDKSLLNNKNNNNHHHLPGVVPFAFNGGQPFSLEKDPVTGQINFDNAPPFKAINLTGTYDSIDDDDNNNNNDKDEIEFSEKIDRTDEHPNEINQYSPSFHDFLNLPVRYSDHEKYTSDKYPLISNSYANTKVQGGTSYKIYNSLNHKNYHPGKASTSQSYSNTRTPYVPRTTTTRKPTTTTVRTTTTTTTTPKPTTTTTAKTKTIGTTVTTKLPTTTTAVTTWKPRPVDRYTDDYDGDSMLPIEKIQHDGIRDDQQFGSFPKFDYDDGYEDYLHQEPEADTSTSTTTTTTTTTAKPTTTSTTTTTTMKTTEVPDVDRATQSPLISVKGPNLNNAIVNGHQNYPSYSGLVVESSSNVIVPPDQDTISFVLGNRQNVQGTYYGHGSALPELPYGETVTVPNRMDHFDHDAGPPPRGNPVSENAGLQGTLNDKPEYPNNPPRDNPTFQFPRDPPDFQTPPPYPSDQNQKWWFNSEQSEKSQSLPENDKDNRVNVVGGYRVAFPTEKSSQSTTLFPSTTIIPGTSEKPGFSELSEILVPPAADKPIRLAQPQRPHYYTPHHHYHSRPSEIPPRIQRLPMNPNSYKIRPPMDLNLPNILPQFRPNIQSPQRRGSEAIGTMIISNPPKHPPRVSVRPPIHPPPSVHRPPPRRQAPASHLQRLKPPPPPPPPPVHTLRLPSPEALVGLREQENKHIGLQADGPIRRNVGGEGLIDERNRGNQVVKSRLNDESTDKLEPPSLPPQPPVFFKRKNGNDTRVATLQMIQHHGLEVDAESELSSDELNGESQNIDRRTGESPVFVVYPVKGTIDIHSEDDSDKDLDESVVIGTHGAQRPLPPDTLSQQTDDEEISPVVPSKLASDFPYPLERPDPSLFVREKPLLVPSDQATDEDDGEGDFLKDQREKDTSINLIPYLQDHVPYAIKQNAISTTLHIGANPLSSSSSPPVTPIAYVYTPTVRDHQPVSSDIYERTPVLLPSQQPSSSSSSAPSPQSFMAPFVASLSAEVPSRNGWSVVTLNPSSKTQDADKRISVNESKANVNEKIDNSTTINSNNEDNNAEISMQTEASDFDVENFKPQLFGGFQPIFEFPSDSAEIPSELKNEEAVGIMDKPRGFEELSPRTSHET